MEWFKLKEYNHDGFTVILECIPDDEPIDGSFDFGNEAENKEYLQKFIDGIYSSYVLRTRAIMSDIVFGTDTLCGCHAKTGDTDELIEIAEYYSMAQIAVDEAIKTIDAIQLKRGMK